MKMLITQNSEQHCQQLGGGPCDELKLQQQQQATTTDEFDLLLSSLIEGDEKNSEKRKEKSRKAARERRSQESQIFDQIEEILPVSAKALSHLDKASLVRIAINYLKLRSVVEPFNFPNDQDLLDTIEASASLDTLDGFVYILSKDGDLVYLSENVERFLGLTAIDTMGQSIYEYTHPCDHDDIKAFLEPLTNASNASKFLPKPTERAGPKGMAKAVSSPNGPLFIRIKSTLTNKGRNLNLKSANYKVAKLTGRMVDLEVACPEQAQLIGDNFRHYIIGVGELIQHPSRTECPSKTDVFVSKHSPDMKFVHVDDCVETLFGFVKTDLIGTSLYDFFDARDFAELNTFFKTLFAKGQCDSGFYRFVVKTGGYRWISTQATILREANSNKPQSVYLVHEVISGIESPNLIVSSVQREVGACSKPESIESCPAVVAVTNTNTTTTTIKPDNNNNNTSASANDPNISLAPIAPIVSSTVSVIRSKAEVFKTEKNKNNSPKVNVVVGAPPLFKPNLSKVVVETPPPLLAKSTLPPPPSTSAAAAVVSDPLPKPVSSTLSILQSSTTAVLTQKTADMESGFIVFTDDNQGMTILSDAEDLTHLAPDAGDLCGSDMDLNDISMLDDLFLSGSYNTTANLNIFADDLFNMTNGSNDDMIDADKLMASGKMCDVGTSMAVDTDNGNGATGKKLNNGSYFEMMMGGGDKDAAEMKSIDNMQYLPNDPFLSYTSSQQSDDLFLNPVGSLSSDSLGESFASVGGSSNRSTNSSTSHSPIDSSVLTSSNPINYSPQSNSSDDLSNKFSLSDSIDFLDDNELEMRAPFIPIDDDYLLDFAYTDSNIDDLFNWISNGKSGGEFGGETDNNNKTSKLFGQQTSQVSGTMPNNNKNSACLEALLQNDELMCNLKNKMYSSNQILNGGGGAGMMATPKGTATAAISKANIQAPTSAPNLVPLPSLTSNNKPTPLTSAALKRKNSNILICTTIANSGDKKIKNLLLNPDNLAIGGGAENSAKLPEEKANVHHFVLTKNNELIPSASLANQTYKVSSKRVLPLDANMTLVNLNNNTITNNNDDSNGFKHDMLSLKRSKNDIDKTNVTSNSVLLNLLVNGSDASHGYKIIPYQSDSNSSSSSNHNNNNNKQRQHLGGGGNLLMGHANISI